MAITRRTIVAAAASVLAPHLAWAGDEGVASAAPPKVLRYAFEVAETSLDPAKINDLYSRTLTPHIFEGLYTYDHLARPVKIKPLTADAMPRHSDDFRVWTDLAQPWVVGYHRNVFVREFWRYVDIDTAEQARRTR